MNGQELWREETVWAWGSNGISYVYLKNFGVGTYELKLQVNGNLLISGTFQIGVNNNSENLPAPVAGDNTITSTFEAITPTLIIKKQ